MGKFVLVLMIMSGTIIALLFSQYSKEELKMEGKKIIKEIVNDQLTTKDKFKNLKKLLKESENEEISDIEKMKNKFKNFDEK